MPPELPRNLQTDEVSKKKDICHLVPNLHGGNLGAAFSVRGDACRLATVKKMFSLCVRPLVNNFEGKMASEKCLDS